MPGFPKPDFSYNYQTASQINALREYRDTEPGRAIPAKDPSRVLIATWNIANLGVHERRDKDHQLIAEIVSWFDLVAVQEVNNNLTGLRGVQAQLPDHIGRSSPTKQATTSEWPTSTTRTSSPSWRRSARSTYHPDGSM